MTRLLRLGLLLSSALLLFVAACGGSDDTPAAPAQPPQPTGAATPVRTPIGVPPAPPTVGPTTVPVGGGEPVAFQTADGAVTLRGNLYAAPGPKRRAVVIASFTPDNESDWQPFARELAGAGIASLTFQMPVYRGLPNGTRDPAQVDKDVETAVLFLESREYPLIYVIADGNAAAGALKMAARRKVAGIVTVSGFPMLDSVNALPDVPKITAPKLFLAGQDSRSPSHVTSMLQAAVEPKQGKVFDGPGTGVKLLTGPDGAAAKQMIRDFLLR